MIRSTLALDLLVAALVARQGLVPEPLPVVVLRRKLSGSLNMAQGLLSEETWSPYELSNDGPLDNRLAIVITSN